ncbi:CAF17-like 4Fe-4S cluster assembly/insertion protein YgfZ [Legionella jordanis]|uniref:Glycine cleavage T protein n=2 Tax=Legionella jordanis TaxID=456 RepID=A0A0W0VAQ4_9GAMM|nr:folate-binding protein YgfZ [Legionella jordanis]KTD17151.1 glycine cleavage T protein [Legionella jordanis]VEH12651.1 glycine cleavage T protein [Legionella jordanis]
MQPEFLINNRPYTLSLALEQELIFDDTQNYLFDLSYLGGLSIEGERAREFLQGQLSCDIRQVSANEMRQGALCNLKGRILALMDVVDWQGMQLILPKDLLGDTKNSMSKTAMLSRVKVEEAHSYEVYGLCINDRHAFAGLDLHELDGSHHCVQTDDFCIYALNFPLCILLIKKEKRIPFIESLTSKPHPRGSLSWHYLNLRQGQVEIYPESRGLFLPHRLDLHLSGHLNFDKGCYKGQEIIARTHYRAKLKHGLRLFNVSEEHIPLQSGQRLFDASGTTEIGELIDCSPGPDRTFLIAASMLLDAPSEAKIEHEPAIIHLNPLT